MPTENVERIGHGSLHVITSEEETTRSEGRSIWISSRLLWFKIANLDENRNIIESQELMFEGENAPYAARDFSDSLNHLITRSYVRSIETGVNQSVVRLDNGNVLIKNGPASLEVNLEDISALADKLVGVEALGTIGLQRN